MNQIHSFRKSSAMFAMASSIASALALASCQLNIGAIPQYIPALTGMNQITATYLIFSSAALWLLFKKGDHRSIRESVRIVSAIISVTGAIEISRAFMQNHPELFSAARISNHAVSRMTPDVAVNMVLLGAAIFFTTYRKEKYRQVANWLAFIIAMAGILCLTGHLPGVREWYAAAYQSPMSAASAVSFLLISLSLLSNNYNDLKKIRHSPRPATMP